MRLAIYRGEEPDRYVDLASDSVRIGRAHENDVVLEDPDKGVSRFHAELRREHGQYVIVDLNSQNGVLLDNRRVTRERVDPGTIITIGPYRLLLEEGHSDDAVGYEVTDAIQPAQVAAAPQPAFPTETRPAIEPYRKPVARPATSRRTVPPAVLIGGAILVGAIGIALVATLSRSARPTPAPETASSITTSIPATTTIGADDEFQQYMRDAQAQLDANQPDAAIAAIDEALRIKPDDPEALALRTKAVALKTPEGPVTSTSGPTPKPEVFAADPRVPRRPNEPQREYRTRVAGLDKLERDARAALDQGDTTKALAILQRIQDEEPNYSNLGPLRQETQQRQTAAAQSAARIYLDNAKKAESIGDLATALREYSRAHETDPSLAEADIARITQAINAAVDAAYREARQNDRYAAKVPQARLDAIRFYQRVQELLPRGHPRRKDADEALVRLQGAK